MFESLIFDQSGSGERDTAHYRRRETKAKIPESALRRSAPNLPELSELQVVRHFTRLSQKNFSIDTHFYPLGSCTMKYNPRGVHRIALSVPYVVTHPLSPVSNVQGILECLYALQNDLLEITGMQGISLAPMAGAQGEFAGVQMIRAYHQARDDTQRDEMICPEAAHGTNPASAVMCGYKVRELRGLADGDIDLDHLDQLLSDRTAGIMLTNPSTLGVFERKIQEVAARVHEAGGLLYYDGANLNAILGAVRPGDMGFDVMHMNLHKTFATPHGGGGPGSGPVAVGERLMPYLPTPLIVREAGGGYALRERGDRPESIGRMGAFSGNVGILIRAFAYIRLLGREGLHRVSDYATLNANYLLARLVDIGYTPAFPMRRATHEFVITVKPLTDKTGVTALDVAKRLLDLGFHAPTIYFPLIVPECLLIEPTETEDKDTLDAFIAAMDTIYREAMTDPERLKQAPTRRSVGRLDEVKAAKALDLAVLADE